MRFIEKEKNNCKKIYQTKILGKNLKKCIFKKNNKIYK